MYIMRVYILSFVLRTGRKDYPIALGLPCGEANGAPWRDKSTAPSMKAVEHIPGELLKC